MVVVVDCEQRKRKRERKSGDSILYFFRTRFPVTGNLGCTTPHRAAVVAGTETLFCLQGVWPARSLARLRFFRLLYAKVFHEDCGVPGRNLKWMPVSAIRHRRFSPIPFFLSPLFLPLFPLSLFSLGRFTWPPYRNLFSQITFPQRRFLVVVNSAYIDCFRLFSFLEFRSYI